MLDVPGFVSGSVGGMCHAAVLLALNCRGATVSWWRHQMKTVPALQALGVANLPVTGESPAQKPVTRSFDVFFDLLLE